MTLPRWSKPRLSAVVIVLAVVSGLSPLATAQSNAQLLGTVRDPSGALVAGANIVLTNSATGVFQKTASNEFGYYLFPSVPVGTYRLKVEQSGFRKYLQEGIVVQVNQNVRVDLTLQIGDSTQVIEVHDRPPQVDTTGATLGKVEYEQRIEDLPLVDRDTLQLGLLQAGVFPPDEDNGYTNLYGLPFSVGGQRVNSTSFLLDGANNSDTAQNEFVVSPNPDAVQEFKILTNNFDAQFGRTSGGIVNQVVKSGTNHFHGDLFEFLRNDALNARDYFLRGQPKATFKRNVFGGTFGGPIAKDRTFFFVSYQGGRRREGVVSGPFTVLSKAERTGDFSDLYTGTVNPQTGFDTGQLFNPVNGAAYPKNLVPVNVVSANYILKYVPFPDIGTSQFVTSLSKKVDEEQGVLRLDHSLTPRDTLSFLYVVNSPTLFTPFQGGNVPTGTATTGSSVNQVGSLSWTHVFRRGWVNKLDFSANRAAMDGQKDVDHTTPQALGFTNVPSSDPPFVAPPEVSVLGAFSAGAAGVPSTPHDTTYQLQEGLVIPHGRHEWRFGGDLRKTQLNVGSVFVYNGQFAFQGGYTGNNLADFVAGFPNSFTQFGGPGTSTEYLVRTSSQYWYGQDTWRVLPRLTLNLGVRYEYASPFLDKNGQYAGYFPGQQSTRFPNAPPGILYPGDRGTPNAALVRPDRNNFAPRFGFAWDMLGKGRLVMRGGYGIFYDVDDATLNLNYGVAPFGVTGGTIFVNSYRSLFASVNPFADPFAAAGVTNPVTNPPPPFQFGVPKIGFAFIADPNFRTSYAENFNFGFQYQASNDLLVEATYVGSLGRKLRGAIDLNPPDQNILRAQLANSGGLLGGGFTNPNCARPLAACPNPGDPNSSPTGAVNLYTVTNASTSSSHQFQLTADKRFSHGFSFRAAYTLSKTFDETSGYLTRQFGFTNPANPRFDYGLADFDVPQRLVISGSWHIPPSKAFRANAFARKATEGWQINSIFTVQSGTPFSIYSLNNSSQLQTFNDRADQIGPTVYLDPREPHTFALSQNDPRVGSCMGSGEAGTPAQFYFDPNQYNCLSPFNPSGLGVPIFSFGNMGRNSLRGPGRNNWDLSLNKETKIGESKSIQFRVELFNAFNHAQFLNPDFLGGSSTFGQITRARAPRLVQIAMKLYF